MAARLHNNVAIVTRASNAGLGCGNGRATAVLFAREGAKVMCIDRSGNAGETVALIRRGGGEAEAITADVTSAEDVTRMIAQCIERFERIDILHNNVGVDRVGGPVETSEMSWDQVIKINLTSENFK